MRPWALYQEFRAENHTPVPMRPGSIPDLLALRDHTPRRLRRFFFTTKTNTLLLHHVSRAVLGWDGRRCIEVEQYGDINRSNKLKTNVNTNSFLLVVSKENSRLTSYLLPCDPHFVLHGPRSRRQAPFRNHRPRFCTPRQRGGTAHPTASPRRYTVLQ